jgi:hypothetical protein
MLEDSVALGSKSCNYKGAKPLETPFLVKVETAKSLRNYTDGKIERSDFYLYKVRDCEEWQQLADVRRTNGK